MVARMFDTLTISAKVEVIAVASTARVMSFLMGCLRAILSVGMGQESPSFAHMV